ncbi:MAG: extracellular matrix regulator RemB [Clostridia bacterium]
MYLHIGGQKMVKQRDIVAILDLETTSVSKKTKEFLRASEKKGVVVNVSEDIPKSYVICNEDGADKIYISQISSATLLKRVE